jgi:hypothetical protein
MISSACVPSALIRLDCLEDGELMVRKERGATERCYIAGSEQIRIACSRRCRVG